MSIKLIPTYMPYGEYIVTKDEIPIGKVLIIDRNGHEKISGWLIGTGNGEDVRWMWLPLELKPAIIFDANTTYASVIERITLWTS